MNGQATLGFVDILGRWIFSLLILSFLSFVELRAVRLPSSSYLPNFQVFEETQKYLALYSVVVSLLGLKDGSRAILNSTLSFVRKCVIGKSPKNRKNLETLSKKAQKENPKTLFCWSLAFHFLLSDVCVNSCISLSSLFL